MLSQILALIIAIVLFSALLQGKYPRYLLTLAAGGAMVLVVLLGTMGSPAAALEALSGNDARNGENPHEYRLFCPSILLLILD